MRNEGSHPPPRLDVREGAGFVTLRVRVQPSARNDVIAGVREGVLIVRVVAPPERGAANLALKRFLAKELQIAPSSIHLLRGRSTREKLLRLDGASVASVLSLPIVRQDAS